MYLEAVTMIMKKEWTRLPFLGDGQDLIRDPADRRVRNLYAVNIPNVHFDISGGHTLGVHRQNLFFDVLTDTGLILFQKLRLKFALAVTRDGYFRIAKTGAQRLAAVTVSAVFSVLVFVVVQFGMSMI